MAETELPDHDQRYKTKDFTWAPNSRPNTPERSELTQYLISAGWEAVLEVPPPAVVNAYNELITNTDELIQSLCDPDSDPPDTSLVAYVRLRHHIELYRTTHGLWFGLPAEARDALNQHMRHLDDHTPYDIGDRHRLLRYWQEQPNPHSFLEELAHDTGPPVGVATPHTPDQRGPDLIDMWRLHCTTDGPERDGLINHAAQMGALWNLALAAYDDP